MRKLLALACLALPLACQAQAYKCTVDGKTVFQGLPCAGSGPTVKDDLKTKEADRAEALALAAKRSKEAGDKAKIIVQVCGERSGKVWIGMDLSEFHICSEMPWPDKINKTQTATSISEQWVFKDHRGIPKTYIYWRDGKVTSWQN